MTEAKSLNSLMKHMRDTHNIKIGIGYERGGQHKIELTNIGYYHGFKGYKFIKNSKNEIKFNNFNEIVKINQFDMELKALIYPKIMFLETAIKNHTLASIFQSTKETDFENIYNNILVAYKEKFLSKEQLNNIEKLKKRKQKEDEYKNGLNKKLNLRVNIYNNLNKNFKNDVKVIQHFYNNHRNVPIWAIFEVMMMGDLGTFISCMKKEVRNSLSQSLSLNLEYDANREFGYKIIFLLKDLRNSIAHNNVIFDARFKTSRVSKNLINGISKDTGVNGIEFNSIVDYIMLITYLLKGIKVSKTELKKFVNSFKDIIDSFKDEVDINIYNKIMHTDIKNKLEQLYIFITK